MTNGSDTDFLPWILGALVVAVAALALAIHAAPNSRPPAPASAQSGEPVQVQGSRLQTPAGQTPAATAPGTPAVQVTPLAPAVAPTVAPVPHNDLPPGQVYECTRQGQRIFSDSPCGERAAIRQLSAVNRMAAVAVTPDAAVARSVPPPQYPVRDANYALPTDPPQTNDSSPGAVLLYPLPVLPYRYHGRPERENRPVNPLRPPQNHTDRAR